MKKLLIAFTIILACMILFDCSMPSDEDLDSFQLDYSDYDLILNSSALAYITDNNAINWYTNNNAIIRISATNDPKIVKITGMTLGTATLSCNYKYNNETYERTRTIHVVNPNYPTTPIFGNYDAWTYVNSPGWIKVENARFTISSTSLVMAGTTLFPNSNNIYKDQKLFALNGQIWMTYKLNNTLQKTYLFDYYFEDNTRYGTKVLWIKNDSTSDYTIYWKPSAETAASSLIIPYILVGNTPTNP